MYILEIKVDCTDEKIISYYNDKSEKSITSQNCDSGVDIVTTEDVEIARNQIGVLNFNIKCQMININENDGTKKHVGYYLYPRSSISSTLLLWQIVLVLLIVVIWKYCEKLDIFL